MEFGFALFYHRVQHCMHWTSMAAFQKLEFFIAKFSKSCVQCCLNLPWNISITTKLKNGILNSSYESMVCFLNILHLKVKGVRNTVIYVVIKTIYTYSMYSDINCLCQFEILVYFTFKLLVEDFINCLCQFEILVYFTFKLLVEDFIFRYYISKSHSTREISILTWLSYLLCKVILSIKWTEIVKDSP